MASQKKNNSVFGFSQNVIVLSLVSFLNDIGGETIKKTIPLFLSNVLGAPTTIIGLVEGVADATPQLFQPISGYISDVFQKRKWLVAFGQLLRSFMLVLFWVTTWPQVLLVRFLDRSGKGIAQAPRDALIADSAAKHHVGRAFGLNRMGDNGGAVVGLVLASILVFSLQQGARMLTAPMFHGIVLFAVIPLIISLFLLTFFIQDVRIKQKQERLVLHNSLGHKFYLFLFFSFLFMLGNSSDAFLILKSQSAGVLVWQIFLLLALYSLVSSLSGLPLSSLSDRIGRKKLLVSGWIVYSVVYFLFARVSSVATITLLFFGYGFYYGLTEGSAKAFVSDIVPAKRHATAYGIYNMVTGVTVFVASLLAGFLWQAISPAAPFYLGSATALVAAVGLWVTL